MQPAAIPQSALAPSSWWNPWLQMSHHNQSTVYWCGDLQFPRNERQFKKKKRKSCLIIQAKWNKTLTVLQIQLVTVETLRGKTQPWGEERLGGKEKDRERCLTKRKKEKKKRRWRRVMCRRGSIFELHMGNGMLLQDFIIQQISSSQPHLSPISVSINPFLVQPKPQLTYSKLIQTLSQSVAFPVQSVLHLVRFIPAAV